jgi:hypothetical protein
VSNRVLRGKQGEFWWSLHSWVLMIEAAHQAGAWYPGPTEPPRLGETGLAGYVYGDAGWHGGWITAEGQTVPAEEAASLAKALEEVLTDLCVKS